MSVPSLPKEGPEHFFPNDIDRIGDLNPDFVESQEQEIAGRASSCEDLDEEEFDEGPYSSPENRSLDDLLWPPELLHNPTQIRSEPRVHQSNKRIRFQEDRGVKLHLTPQPLSTSSTQKRKRPGVGGIVENFEGNKRTRKGNFRERSSAGELCSQRSNAEVNNSVTGMSPRPCFFH